MSVVLGFDTSLTTTGCARIDLGFDDAGATVAVRREMWRSTTAKPDEETVMTMRRRIRLMLRGILQHVPDFFDLAVIEGPAIGAKHAALADERAGLRWMLIDQLLARGPVVIVSPKTRAAVAADNGNAGKPEVLAAVRASHPGLYVPDHNAADALTLAEIGAHHLGLPLVLSEKQSKALANVAWH